MVESDIAAPEVSGNQIPQERLFYTDPLAAAWMAKHFGTAFQCRDRESDFFRDIEFTLFANDVHWSAVVWELSDRRFYIHPDSLHLLEPQPGDLFRFGERGPVYECIPDHDDSIAKLGNIPLPPQWEVSYAREKNRGRIKIIQRNGIAFMLPESEGV
jgi:hypothetical protein